MNRPFAFKPSVRFAALALAVSAGCTMSRDGSTRSSQGVTSSAAVEARDVTHVSEVNASNVMNFPTGDRSTSVLQVEQFGPREVRAGAPYSYEIRIKNLTDKTFQNVSLRATKPEGLTLAPAADGSAAPQSDDKGWLTYGVGTLGPRETRTFQVSGTPTGTAAIRQTYDVKFEQQMSTAVNVTAPAAAIAKTGPMDADICEEIVWTYTARNTGSGILRGAVLRDQLPDGLTTRDGQTLVTAELGDIPAGESRMATARLKATRVGKFASVATLTSQVGEVKSESVGLTVRQPRLDLAVKGPGQEYVGKVATYQVMVTNSGDTAARNVVLRLAGAGGNNPTNVTDSEGAPLVIGSGAPAGSIALGVLDAGKTRTVNVSFQPRQGGVFTLDATVSGRCAPEVRKAIETNILTVGALLLEAVDVQDPVKIGDNVVYRIRVTNQGSGPDTNVKVTATLPEGEEFIKAVGTTEGSGTGQTIHFANIPTIAPKETVTWEVTAKATKAGDVQFKVQATSDSVKVPAEKAEPTKLY